MPVRNRLTIRFAPLSQTSGVVSVPDKRLDALAEMYHPDKFTPATLEFVDIAGLVKGASKGEGLGNKFLSNIREVDAIVHVVRCFEDLDIIHVDGEIGPKRDIETINLELIFSDLEILDRRIDKTRKMVKADKKYQVELEFLEELHSHLEEGKAPVPSITPRSRPKSLKRLPFSPTCRSSMQPTCARTIL